MESMDGGARVVLADSEATAVDIVPVGSLGRRPVDMRTMLQVFLSCGAVLEFVFDFVGRVRQWGKRQPLDARSTAERLCQRPTDARQTDSVRRKTSTRWKRWDRYTESLVQ